ncbi:MAG TPA: hypothetical protein VFT27_11295 [Actinomycetota bacterium]|nr:hypothetical protein [Actinomycetota bacterium]
MRFARPLLVTAMVIAPVACGGGDDAAPLPIDQRFITADEAPGTRPDPVEKRETTGDFEEFIGALSETAIDPDQEEMTTVFREAGFKEAGVDARFFGETHEPSAPHVISWFVELESEDGARSALDWLEADRMKPCPGSCATRISTFDVDDIAEARGVHRIATAEDIEAAAGPADEQPFEAYWIGFTLGPVVYAMELHGPPGSVSEEQAQGIARAYHERLTGN